MILNTNTLKVSNEATISARTFGPGRGGNLTISATDIELSNGGSIAAESLSMNPDAGQSGKIVIRASDTFRLFDDSYISVETAQADAGDINLTVGSLLHLPDQSSITTSVAGGTGNGGNITIDPVFTVLDGASEIVARAREGSGGNIRITTDFLFQSPDSRIDASSEFGISGTVEIDSPDTDITGGDYNPAGVLFRCGRSVKRTLWGTCGEWAEQPNYQRWQYTAGAGYVSFGVLFRCVRKQSGAACLGNRKQSRVWP